MKKFLKLKKVQATILIVVAILLEIVIAFLFRGKKESYAENLSYACDFVSSIFVIGGVVIAVWQYYLSSKCENRNLQIVQVQRAIDLSEYYKDNILKYSPCIIYIFEHTGIKRILDEVRINDLRDFDIHELERLFTTNQIEELQELQNSDIFMKSVVEANDIYGLNFNLIAQKVVTEDQEGKQVVLKIDKNSIVVSFMSNLINATLNNMEYFALHFKHNTADETVVYQSLHKTYLELVKYLYYYIANNNRSSTNKLYTNVIWLFKEWRKKQADQNDERSIKAESLQSHGTVIEKQQGC